MLRAAESSWRASVDMSNFAIELAKRGCQAGDLFSKGGHLVAEILVLRAVVLSAGVR